MSSSQHHAGTLIDKKRSIFHRGGKAVAPGAMHVAMNDFLKGKEGLKKAREARRAEQKMNPPAGDNKNLLPHPKNDLEPQHEIADAHLEKNDNTRDWGDAEHPDTLATLSCEAHGGPDTEAAQEMVYWHDIPSDSKYQSPLFRQDGVERYLTFEPDGGGEFFFLSTLKQLLSCFNVNANTNVARRLEQHSNGHGNGHWTR